VSGGETGRERTDGGETGRERERAGREGPTDGTGENERSRTWGGRGEEGPECRERTLDEERRVRGRPQRLGVGLAAGSERR
jgi:hypothetical protein